MRTASSGNATRGGLRDRSTVSTPSTIFSTDRYHEIERRTVEVLNASDDFLSAATVTSPRAVGDAVQSVLSDRFEEILGGDVVEF